MTTLELPKPEHRKTTVCAICALQPSKYTCPACSTRTCSLPCSLRHKAWKSCSGVRSPSTYLPRSALATPVALDRDFNFLSGLDRDIERREDRIAEKGIKLADEGDRRGPGVWTGGGKKKGGQRVEERCRELGIRVVKAPKGLQRARENKTRWDGSKNCVMWCVEWIEYEARSLTLLSETLPLKDGWTQLVKERWKNDKKRKRGQDESIPDEMDRSFYLYLPRPSPKAGIKPGTKALVLLKSDTILSSCLKYKVVIEYPTIYVFSRPSRDVPDGYCVLEDKEVPEDLYGAEPHSIPEHKDRAEANPISKDKGVPEDLYSAKPNSIPEALVSAEPNSKGEDKDLPKVPDPTEPNSSLEGNFISSESKLDESKNVDDEKRIEAVEKSETEPTFYNVPEGGNDISQQDN